VGEAGGLRPLGALLGALLAACAAHPPAREAAAGGIPVHGTLTTRYRGRTAAPGGSDQDLYGTLSLDAGGDADDGWSAHVQAQAALDLDGAGDPVFTSLQDSGGSALFARLDEAHADWRGSGPVARASLGRQLHLDTPVITWFDGLRLESRAVGRHELSAGLFGGVPVHPYESSPAGDLLVGAFAEGLVGAATRVRLDWLHAADRNARGGHVDDLLAVSARRALGESLFLELSHSRIGGKARDVRLRASWLPAESDFAVEARYERLLTPQRDLAVPLDPFTATLRELAPYQQLTLVASKGLGKALELEAGADVRRLVDGADAGAFDHDFERWHATLTVEPPPLPGLSASFTADVWRGEDVIETWDVDLTQRLGATRVSLGSSYALYDYDLFSADERDHVRTSWVRARRTLARVSFEVGYELQEDDVGTFHTVRVSTTCSF